MTTIPADFEQQLARALLTSRDMLTVAAIITRHQMTAPKPVAAPNISAYRAQPPARIRWSREAWEAIYPFDDYRAKWWKAWPDKPDWRQKFFHNAALPEDALDRINRFIGENGPRVVNAPPFPDRPDFTLRHE